MSWSIRNYNAVLRGLRERGLSHKEAQTAYRGLKERLGRSVKGVDLIRHPLITKQEVRKAPRESKRREGTEKVASAGGRTIGSVPRYEEIWDDEPLYDVIDLDVSADYEED